MAIAASDKGKVAIVLLKLGGTRICVKGPVRFHRHEVVEDKVALKRLAAGITEPFTKDDLEKRLQVMWAMRRNQILLGIHGTADT